MWRINKADTNFVGRPVKDIIIVSGEDDVLLPLGVEQHYELTLEEREEVDAALRVPVTSPILDLLFFPDINRDLLFPTRDLVPKLTIFLEQCFCCHFLKAFLGGPYHLR